MKNKNFINKLETLKSLKADESWKMSNRDTLISQIYGSEKRSLEKSYNFFNAGFTTFPSWMRDFVSQPVVAVVFICCLVASGSLFSARLSENSKPGDSLYIAKKINEKTQKALTFTTKDKAQLSLAFAKKRFDELGAVLMEDNNDENQEKVAKLLGEFKTEINNVKYQIEKIDYDSVYSSEAEVNRSETEVAVNSEIEQTEDQMPVENGGDAEDVKIFSAKMTKDENGIDIHAPNGDDNQDPQDILAQAKVLLDNNDYGATMDILSGLDSIVDTTVSSSREPGQDNASSTPAGVIEDGYLCTSTSSEESICEFELPQEPAEDAASTTATDK